MPGAAASLPAATLRFAAKLSFTAALLISGALPISGCRHSAPEAGAGDTTTSAPVRVELAPVALHPMETTVGAQGTLTAAPGGAARIAAVATGRLLEVLVREGDTVTPGQVLAVVDNRAANAALQSAKSALASAQSDVRQAQLAQQAAAGDQTASLKLAQLNLEGAVHDRDNAVAQARIALSAAQSDLRKTESAARATDVSNALQQAQLALKAARADREGSIANARNALQSAQTDLDRLSAGARPQEIEQAEQAVLQAQTTLDRDQTEVVRARNLYDHGVFAKRQLEDAETALRVAESALRSVRAQASLVRAGARPEEIRAAALKVDNARDLLSQAQQSGDAKVQEAAAGLQLAEQNLGQAAVQRPEDVRAAGLRVAAARDALAQAGASGDARVREAQTALTQARQGVLQVAAKGEDVQAKRSAASGKAADYYAAQTAAGAQQLRAPIGGIVTKRNLNPGDMADPGTPVVEITDPMAFTLAANIPADEGARVRPGMLAHITAEIAPGRVFVGQVTSLGQVDPQTGLLTVRIAVANARGELKVGALAMAEIVLQSDPLAVVVPKQAVLTRDEKSIVFVAGSDDKAHLREVTIGPEQDDLIQIVHGLKPGEKVVRLGNYELADGSAIRVAAAANADGTADSGDAAAKDTGAAARNGGATAKDGS